MEFGAALNYKWSTPFTLDRSSYWLPINVKQARGIMFLGCPVVCSIVCSIFICFCIFLRYLQFYFYWEMMGSTVMQWLAEKVLGLIMEFACSADFLPPFNKGLHRCKCECGYLSLYVSQVMVTCPVDFKCTLHPVSSGMGSDIHHAPIQGLSGRNGWMGTLKPQYNDNVLRMEHKKNKNGSDTWACHHSISLHTIQ